MITHQPNPQYSPAPSRYQTMKYQRCGNSGIVLPRLSLGLWQNFGETDSLTNARNLLTYAFDLGINHFDLANNYGPPYGAAESTFGEVYKRDLINYRDELLISSKAGYDMWPGPYGIGGSRKYLVASCDQSLKRTGLDYFDIFYHHKMDPDTPIEETAQALDYIVRSGRALYVGISNYQPEQTKKMVSLLRDLGTPLLINQPRYNLFDRWIENGLTDVLLEEQVGSIVFSPLAQGRLTSKYLKGIPKDSRIARSEIVHLNENDLDENILAKTTQLNLIANGRNQSLAQMAIAWTLNNPAVTSCLIGASKVDQIKDSVAALDNLSFSAQELVDINKISQS